VWKENVKGEERSRLTVVAGSVFVSVVAGSVVVSVIAVVLVIVSWI